MADYFELAYVYARVCGSLSRAFLGERAAGLARSGRLSEIWRSLFGDAPPALTESSLLKAAQRRTIREALAGFRALALELEAREPFFECLRRKLEYARVKKILIALRNGSRDGESLPPNEDPHLECGFDESAFPDLGAMFSSGRYSWIGEESLAKLPETENRLDKQFYTELWESISSIGRQHLGALRDLVAEEIELENVVWALRLKRYYRMGRDDIAERLVVLEGAEVEKAALAVSDLSLDKRSDWRKWRWESLIEGEEESSWRLDVRLVEAAARRRLYRDVRRALHMYPFTYTPLYCFFKIKEFEMAAILGTLEGIHLGAPHEETASFVLGLTGGNP
jgi:hypothetical protein